MKNRVRSEKKSKIELVHQYYAYTGFYTFILNSFKKALFPIVIIIVALILFNQYVYSINEGLHLITKVFSDIQILVVFFISESFLGLIPPEIFIAWSKKTANPIVILFVLSTLSYIGGIVSYFIGKSILKIEKAKLYFEDKLSKHLKNTSKWGGFLIAIGALFPIPFSITCMAGGMIKYPFRGVLLFGLLRFVRFAIYGVAIFQMVS